MRYPAQESWLGTIDRDTQQELERSKPLEVETVPQKTINSYFDEVSAKNMVIKIDAEGYELPILKGAARTIAQNRPFVLFECWPGSRAREQIWRFFQAAGYDIGLHAWTGRAVAPLSEREFLAHPGHNFWSGAKDRNSNVAARSTSVIMKALRAKTCSRK